MIPALFVSCVYLNFYIYTKLFQLFLPCGIHIAAWNSVHLSFTHALFQNHLFQGSAPFWSHFVLYEVRIVTTTTSNCYKNSTLLHRNMVLAQSTYEVCDFKKEKGVKPTLIAQFHSRSNGQAKSLDFKTTPNSTTGKTPAELFLNRQLSARLGLIRPDLSRKIFDKCSDQKSKTDKGSNEREFTRDLLWNRYLDLT